jgi:hypothetical protein
MMKKYTIFLAALFFFFYLHVHHTDRFYYYKGEKNYISIDFFRSQVNCDMDASFTIHPGGKLVLDGGTLTNACEDEMWQGITVLGNPSLQATNGSFTRSNFELNNDYFGETKPGALGDKRDFEAHIKTQNSGRGTYKVKTEPDCWTVRTLDRKPSAHFEHQLALTENGTEMLSTYEYFK